MTTPRTTLSAVLLSLVLLPLGACHGASGGSTFVLVANNLKLPYWQSVNSGFEHAASQYRVKTRLVGPDNYDVDAELTALRSAINSHPAGIIISVAEGARFREDINNAIQAGIPVITVDSDAPTSERLFFIGTNNMAAGHLGGDRLVEKLNGKGNVVFFTITGQPNLEERMHGYKDVLSDHPNMHIVETVDVKGETGPVFDRVRDLVGRTGAQKVDAFVSLESSSGPAVAEALQRANVSDRTVIAMDVSPDMLKLIQSGAVDSTVSQKPWTMGYTGLVELDDIAHHKPESFENNYTVDPFSRYPGFIDTGTALITRDNVQIYLESQNKASAQ